VKKIFRLVCVGALGSVVFFGLWRGSGSIPLAVWVTVLTVVPTIVGFEMTITPPTTARAKVVYRVVLGAWAVATCVLAFVQFRQTRPLIPRLPLITVETLSGLPEGLAGNPHLRLHRLQIRNANDVAIEDFCSRFQLPEPLFATVETNRPPGTAIGWRPLVTKTTVSGTGNRSVIGPSSSVNFVYSPACFFPVGNRAQLSGFCERGDSTGVWELTIDKLPPNGVGSLMFLTSDDGDATNYISFAKTAFTNDGATFAACTQGTPDGSVIMHSSVLMFIVHTNKVLDPKRTGTLVQMSCGFFSRVNITTRTMARRGRSTF
jgi:hypothetical protein